MPETKPETMPETKPEKPEIKTCDLCAGRINPPNNYGPICSCAERYGHLLFNAHCEYQEAEAIARAGKDAPELLPVCIITRSGARLNVDGGLELVVSKKGEWVIVLLHDVAADFADLDMNLHFDQAEIALDEISWVGFNLP